MLGDLLLTAEYIAAHLRMRSIQDRFKYLESNHPQVFVTPFSD